MPNYEVTHYATLTRLTIAGLCLSVGTNGVVGQTDTAPAGALRSVSLVYRSLLLRKALAELADTDKAARAESVYDTERAEQDVRVFRQTIEDLWQKTAQWEVLAAHPDFADPAFGRALAGWAYQQNDHILLQTINTSGLLPTDDADMIVYRRLVDLTENSKARALVEALAQYGGSALATGAARDTNETYGFVNSLLTGVDTRYVARRAQAVLHASTETAFTPTQKMLLQTLANLVPAPDPTPLAQQRKKGYYDALRHQFIAPRPDALPTLAPGQRFLYLPDDQSGSPLRDATTGAVVPTTQLALQALRLQKFTTTGQAADSQALDITLKPEGGGPAVRWQGTGSLYDLPSLLPIVEDDTVRTLRRRYQGHTVYPYSPLDSTPRVRYTVATSVPAVPAAKITAIYRLRTGRQFLADTGGYGEFQETIYTHDPLLVVSEAPRRMRLPQHWSLGTPITQSSAISVNYGVFADAWDFERTCTLIPFPQAVRTWHTKQRRAALRGKVVPGMTPEQVAYLIGWPAIYGSKAELSRRPVWDYPRPAPFYETVTFNKGRVTRYDEGGMLP